MFAGKRFVVATLLLLLVLFFVLHLPNACVQVPGWPYLPLAVRRLILDLAESLSVVIGGFESC
jgi:hypothetical protein